MQRNSDEHHVARGTWPGPLLQEHTLKTLISTFFKKREKEPHWLNSNPMWAKLQQWSAALALSRIWTAAADRFTLLPRSRHPTDVTPTMESCSRSSEVDKLVLWSQEYFRLMESWRFLKNDSRSRASLKNCGDKRKATWCSVHHDTKMEKEQPHCAGWLDSPGSQRPRQGNSRAGCHKAHWTQYNR